MNAIANTIVLIKPTNDAILFPSIKEWWAYVTVIPEHNNNIVFNRGSSLGFIANVPIGGHKVPISILGDKALWKNAQNIAKKKSASEIIKSPTPKFKPFCTAKVWWPK